jgi:hypothetical protein
MVYRRGLSSPVHEKGNLLGRRRLDELRLTAKPVP